MSGNFNEQEGKLTMSEEEYLLEDDDTLLDDGASFRLDLEEEIQGRPKGPVVGAIAPSIPLVGEVAGDPAPRVASPPAVPSWEQESVCSHVTSSSHRSKHSKHSKHPKKDKKSGKERHDHKSSRRSRSTERREKSDKRRRSRSVSPRRQKPAAASATVVTPIVTAAALRDALETLAPVSSPAPKGPATQTLSSASPVGVVGPVCVATADPEPLAVLPVVKASGVVTKQPPHQTKSSVSAETDEARYLREGAKPKKAGGKHKFPPATSAAPHAPAKTLSARVVTPAQTEQLAPAQVPPPQPKRREIRLVRGSETPRSYSVVRSQPKGYSPTQTISDTLSITGGMEDLDVVARQKPIEAMETQTEPPTTVFTVPLAARATTSTSDTIDQPAETQTGPPEPTRSAASSLSGTATDEGSEVAPANPEPPMQEQQSWRGQELPWGTRNIAYVHKLLIAWMAFMYGCPYPGCSFKSNRTRPVGLVDTPATSDLIIRPDRHSDFLEHWWVTHMRVTLKFQCEVPGCKMVSRLYKVAANFIKHLKTSHYPGCRSNDPRVAGAVDNCTQAFADAVGDAPSADTVNKALTYPPKHVTLKHYLRVQQEEAKANEAAGRTHARKLELPRESPLPAPTAPAAQTTSTSDRKRPNTSATGSAHSSKVSRVEKPNRVGPLVEGFLRTDAAEDRCNTGDVGLISKAFGRINYVYGFGVKEQLDIATRKMEGAYYNKVVVWDELNAIRVALARFRDDLDGGVRSLSTWQSSLFPNRQQTHCPKVLVNNQILQDAQRLVQVEEELEISNNTNVRLGKDLQMAQIRIRELEARVEVVPVGAGEQALTLPPAALGAPDRQMFMPIRSGEAPPIQAMLVQLHNLMGHIIDEGQLPPRQ